MGKKKNPFKRPAGPFEYRDVKTRIEKLNQITDLKLMRDAVVYCLTTKGVQREVSQYATRRLANFSRWMQQLSRVLYTRLDFTELGASRATTNHAAWFPFFARGLTPLSAAVEAYFEADPTKE